jgi:hypothetical protein
MRGSWKSVSVFILITVIAFGMIAPSLQAGPAARGSFKLTFDAKWGRTTLRAGDYTFSVDHITSNGMIFVYRGSQAVGLVHAQVFNDDESQSKNPELVCIRHDGNVTVRALRLPHVGTFYFSLPKQLTVLVAQQPELIETVSVEVSAD